MISARDFLLILSLVSVSALSLDQVTRLLSVAIIVRIPRNLKILLGQQFSYRWITKDMIDKQFRRGSTLTHKAKVKPKLKRQFEATLSEGNPEMRLNLAV